jgi:hypothetical protein
MHKRFLATTVVALALIFSQGGSFLVAALCPHFTSKAVSCETSGAPAKMEHHDMDHMQMDSSEQEPSLYGVSIAASVGEPMGTCNHCAMHSGRNSTASLHEWSMAQRSGDPAISFSVATPAPVSTPPKAVLAFRAHGPPGNEISRHILINVFRI